jgi:prepilin-type N-terminal cleavage/methylation domain-containing protein
MKKAFTLIELLAVIAIIAILSPSSLQSSPILGKDYRMIGI